MENSKISKAQFYNDYIEKVYPNLLTKEAKSIRCRWKLLSVINKFLFILFPFSMFYFYHKTWVSGCHFFIIGFICLYISTLKSRYKALIKSKYNILLESFGLKWSQGQELFAIPKTYVDSKLFIDGELVSEDDVFTGEYKGVKLRVAETSVLVKIENDNSTHYNSIFEGVVIDLQLNKTVKSRTIIRPKHLNFKKLLQDNVLLTSFLIVLISGYLKFIMGNIEGLMEFFFVLFVLLIIFITAFFSGKIKKYKDIKLEDVKLSKNFEIYSKDEIEARYFFTTAFIDRFLKLCKAFKTNDIRCSVENNSLIIAIPTKRNLFEIGGIASSIFDLQNKKRIDRFYDEINSIFMIIDYLKVYEKTGM